MVEIRRISIDQWEVLRDLRLRALAEDPDAFGMTFGDASGQSDAEWRDSMARLARPGFLCCRRRRR